jgi:beta-lactamase class D
MKISRYITGILLAIAALSQGAAAQAGQGCKPAAKATAAFEQDGVQGTFVLMNTRTGQRLCHNPKRAETGLLPASTYKIPNALIALESGVASGADFPLAWNQKRNPRQPWWPQAWAGDQTLQTALPNSVVWYFQELARRINPQRMQAYVDRFDYGNRNITGGIDQFWLTGGLRISALQQVDFLDRFYSRTLGVSDRATDVVKKAIILEKEEGYTLSGKTGMAGFGEASMKVKTGWLVGYLETSDNTYIYAMNMDVDQGHGPELRMKITKAIMQDLGLI